MTTAVKHHFFMIAGVIMFAQSNPDAPEEDPQMGSVPVNAMVRHDDKNFPVRKLAKAQANLHKSFVTKLPAEAMATLQIHDIVLTSVSYLGHMTEEEFTMEESEPVSAPVPERI